MKHTVSETLADRICALENVPARVQDTCRDLLVDVAGLCVAARHGDYVGALKRSLDAGGPCTALGHTEAFSPEDAARLPAEITKRLNADINKALASPALQARLAGEAIDPMPMAPEQFARFIQADIARWSALARERRISLDD